MCGIVGWVGAPPSDLISAMLAHPWRRTRIQSAMPMVMSAAMIKVSTSVRVIAGSTALHSSPSSSIPSIMAMTISA